MNNINNNSSNILATEKIHKLLIKFSGPAIISGLVSAIYNIVDQIFIGHSVGVLGNAATSIAFPIVTITLSLTLLSGIGTSSAFSLAQGKGETDKTKHIIGSGLFLAMFLGIILSLLTLGFLDKLLYAFGSTEAVFPYAKTYTGITALGIPFVLFSTAGSFLIRADGSPKFSMITILSGAITNIILDPILIFKFNMGMAGAAWATVIGQFLAFLMAVYYFKNKFHAFKINLELITKPSLKIIKEIAALGMAPSFNQLSLMAVQITTNNVLTYYGEHSIYGGDVPLACIGIIIKICIIYIAIVVGIGQGAQPVFGFNYGAQNYERVKETYKLAITLGIIVSSITFGIFQIFPRELIGIFGKGNEVYFMFAERLFRIYLFFTFLNGIQPLTGGFFTSIGKAKIGVFISLTRQFLFLVPLIIIFPYFMGIDGFFYAGPVADFFAVSLGIYFGRREMKILDKLILERDKSSL